MSYFDAFLPKKETDNIMIVRENKPVGSQLLASSVETLLNSYSKSANAKPAETKTPKYTPEKKDDFLEGFNDPYGEKEDFPRQSLAQSMVKQFANPAWQTPQSPMIKMEEPKYNDSFLEGFNYYSDDDTVEKPKGISGKIEDVVEKVKTGWDVFNEYKRDNRTINAISKTLDHYGKLDDVTNTFFKSYDTFSDISKASRFVAPRAKTPLATVTQIAQSVIPSKNYIANKKVDLSRYNENGRYINDQNADASKMSDLQYGLWDMENNGCGVIAAYNTLNTLGDKKDVRDVARDFELNGKVLEGAFGTSPYKIGEYFEKKGYDVKTYEGQERIDNLDFPEAEAYILSFWNSNRFSGAIHTVSINKRSDGTYKIYNSDGKSAEIVDNMKDYLFEERKYGRRIPLVLHCISRKGEGK